jgi:2'-5' RNA ligase
MVALYPPREIAEKIALEDGEPVDQLHVTLVYLGNQEWTGEQLDQVRRIVAQACAFTLPIPASIAGSGVFTEGEKPVTYLAIDAPGINRLRERIFDRLKSAGIPVSEDHSFTPHLTLRYGDPPEDWESPRGVRFTFTDLVIAVDDDRFAAFPLALTKGERPVTGSLTEDSPFWDLSFLAKKRKRIHGKFAKESGPLVPRYDPSKLTFGKFAGGSNGARIAHHDNGSKWLVKRYGGNRDRVATEVLSNAIYREMGARVPKAGLIKLHNGDTALSYPLLDGKPKPYVFRKQGPSEEVGKHFMTDALLANWDVAGLEDDNILWDKKGAPFRVDQGGTLEFRAQGGRKAYGPVPYEVVTLMSKQGQGRRSSKVSLSGMREQAREIRQRLSPARIDSLVDAAGFRDPEMRERVRKNLKARVSWMGGFGDGLIDLPDAPPVPEPAPKLPPLKLIHPTGDPIIDMKKGWGSGKLWEGGITQLSEMYDRLVEAATLGFHWEPHLHPRDQHGKFRKTIGSLGLGQGVLLDAKTRVGRDKNGSYRVTRSGLPTRGFLHPADAARYAMDLSAKSAEPDSIGGGMKHKDYNAYLKYQGFNPNDPEFFGGEKVTDPAQYDEIIAGLEQALGHAQALGSSDKTAVRTQKAVKARLDEAKKKRAALGKSAIPPSPNAPAAKPGGPEEAYNEIVGSLAPKPAPTPAVPGTPFTDKPTAVSGIPRRFFHAEPSGAEIEAYLMDTPNGVVRWGGNGPTDSGTDNPHRVRFYKGLWEYQQLDESGGPAVEAESLPDLLTKIGKPVSGSPVAPIPYAGKPIKGFQENTFTVKDGNGNPVTTWDGVPYLVPLKDLDIAPGDVIQYKKGGWKYTVTEVKPSGGVIVQAANGQKKSYSGYKPVKFVKKSDGSQLQVKTEAPDKVKAPDKNLDSLAFTGGTLDPSMMGPGEQIKKNGIMITALNVAGTPSWKVSIPNVGAKNYTDPQLAKEAWATGHHVTKPPPLTPDQIKAKLSSGSEGSAIKDLPDGSVIGTPDGKIAVLALSEDAYNKGQPGGYVKAYDILTGLPFEPPADAKPHLVSSDPDIIKQAADALAKAKTSGTVSTPSGGTAPASKSKIGPPPQFAGIPSWHAASVILKKQQKGLPLAVDEETAVKSYTGSGYSAINAQVRNSKEIGSIEIAKRIAGLDRAIEKAGAFQQDVVIGRKTSLPEWQHAKVGSAIQDNGFLSTSTDPNVWSGNVHLHIIARKGTRGLILGKETTTSSSGSGEAEVILARGTQFHVLKREDKGNGTVVLYVETIV